MVLEQSETVDPATLHLSVPAYRYMFYIYIGYNTGICLVLYFFSTKQLSV